MLTNNLALLNCDISGMSDAEIESLVGEDKYKLIEILDDINISNNVEIKLDYWLPILKDVYPTHTIDKNATILKLIVEQLILTEGTINYDVLRDTLDFYLCDGDTLLVGSESDKILVLERIIKELAVELINKIDFDEYTVWLPYRWWSTRRMCITILRIDLE